MLSYVLTVVVGGPVGGSVGLGGLACRRGGVCHQPSVACTSQVMTKAAADASFVEKETTRLKKMMDDGSVKASKKESFGRRLNMLSSFSS